MAILCHKKLDSVIIVIRSEVDWYIAVQLKINNKEFIVLNGYTEYQQNEDVYLNVLAFINSFIHYNHSSVYVVGDMNADLSYSLFATHMLQFCDDNNLILSNQLLLPAILT